MTEEMPQGASEGVIAFLFGHPDPSTLMTPEFQSAVQAVMNHPQAFRTLQYGNEQGTTALIGFLVDYLNRVQGLSLTSDNVMITGGSTGAVDMVARLYTQPGGVVLVEAPSYADSLHVFRDHHVELRSVPMDENGLMTAELEKLLLRLRAENKSPHLLYTIPNYHNPTGITASAERRREVIRLAKQYGFLIVEDDVYRDLGFKPDVPPTYYGLTGGEQTISIGSFSKTLAPGMRLGWLVGLPKVIENGINCGVTQMGGGTNPFASQIVTEYCCSGHWEKHVERLRAIYQKRCETMLAALDRYMPSNVRWTNPAGGFFLWLYLPETILARNVKKLALEKGVSVSLGENFFANPADGSHNLRLAFSYASLDDIEKGIQKLSEVIRGL